jgi:sugar phosphate permease
MHSFWRKWGLLLALVLGDGLNYLGRQTISVLGPALETEMRRDNPALGWLLGVFYYSYTLAHFVVGPLLDRSNLRWAFGLAVLVWSLVSAMTGIAAECAGLLAFRLLLGIAESPNLPAVVRIVARTCRPLSEQWAPGFLPAEAAWVR